MNLFAVPIFRTYVFVLNLYTEHVNVMYSFVTGRPRCINVSRLVSPSLNGEINLNIHYLILNS